MKVRIIKFSLIVLFLSISAGLPGVAQNLQSSQPERSIDQAKIEKFKADSDFDYGLQQPSGPGLWDRIKMIFLAWLGKILQWGATNPAGRALLIIFCVVVVVWVALKLLGVKAKSIFYPQSNSNIAFEVSDENINEMDFETLIYEAIDKKEYRNAVRLIYLSSLKILADKNEVTWATGKTNLDYAYEIKTKELKTLFTELGYYFDYAWYGGLPVSEKVFKEARNVYEGLQKKSQG